MRKHRPLEGCGCLACKAGKLQKRNLIKRTREDQEYELQAEGDEEWPR